jgi:gluconate 2-dehydrogenase gamma chain
LAEQLSEQGRSRRHFITDSAVLAKGSLLVLTVPAIVSACREAQQAILSGEEFQTLTEEEANEFAAMAARIIPSDETPGATEAGVIYFMDNVLGDESRAEILESLKSGMLEMQTVVALDYNAPYFHALDVTQQDAVLRQIETTPFFNTIRYLTVAGMFSLPQYGGNRNDIGFQLIGIPGHGAWSPPFGYYDADYMEKGE